jgi:Nucleotide-diphospho-sugar transferase
MRKKAQPFRISLSFWTSIFAICLAFYAGLWVGYSRASLECHDIEAALLKLQQDSKRDNLQQRRDTAVHETISDQSPRFPDSVQAFAAGMARITRTELAKFLNLGVPLDPSKGINNEALILYTESALPTTNNYAAQEAISMTQVPLVDPMVATENCDYLNLVLTHPGSRRQCIAVMGQYEGFHIQKYMRLPLEGKLDSNQPLRYVNRGAQSSGRASIQPPPRNTTLSYWKDNWMPYVQSLERILQELSPIAEKVARKNAIIVMVCNFGQSDLLLNSICGARRRGLDTSSILVFATDEETRDRMHAMGVAVYYDEILFDKLPQKAARRYADATFRALMLAKVWCVHLVNQLGYDVLFQDVDVVWFKDPLDYFEKMEGPMVEFDFYFQDDGNHALFYAPYSANTGFYYVRNNAKTIHFFNALVSLSDWIVQMKSHQIALVALLQEHASLFGLQVYIFARDSPDFPGGYAYHNRKDYMRDLVAGAVEPVIFHMSWTLNKDNKVSA